MTENTAPWAGPHAMQAAPVPPAADIYVLRLYVTGASSRSVRAIANVRKICDEYLEGRHELEVVDISQHPALAAIEQILAAPTLIKTLPLPVRRFVGDMSWPHRLIAELNLHAAPAPGGR